MSKTTVITVMLREKFMFSLISTCLIENSCVYSLFVGMHPKGQNMIVEAKQKNQL
jgi:hypothetical protein